MPLELDPDYQMFGYACHEGNTAVLRAIALPNLGGFLHIVVIASV